MKHMPFFSNPMLKATYPIWRGRLVLSLIGIAFLALIGRAIYLQGFTTEFLQQQGEKRYEHTLTLHASRGKILDRHDVVLAASIPANAIAFQPRQHRKTSVAKMQSLADLLEMPLDELRTLIWKAKAGEE
jgi:cell division protein FtsI (penicillin-binding protein 3)